MMRALGKLQNIRMGKYFFPGDMISVTCRRKGDSADANCIACQNIQHKTATGEIFARQGQSKGIIFRYLQQNLS